MLLFLNFGWVVNFTQSFFITFLRVSQQLRVASPRSRAMALMWLPMMSSSPYFQKARSWYQIILNFLYICHSRNLRLIISKGKQLNLNILKLPLTKNGSSYGPSFRLVIFAKTHLHTLRVTLGILSVKRLTILLIVSVPVTKSPPPRYWRTLMSQSELKLRQSRCMSRSSMIQKKCSLKNSSLENSKGSIFSLLLITSVSLSIRNLWLQNWICSYCSMRLSSAVSKRQKEGTAFGYSHRMIGSESSANGTTRMTEQGMNLIMSILMRWLSASSYPVNSQSTLVLQRLTIHLVSFQRSLDPCTSVYLASLRMNLALSSSVFSRSVNSFFFSFSIWWWSSTPYLLRCSSPRARAFRVFVSIVMLISNYCYRIGWKETEAAPIRLMIHCCIFNKSLLWSQPALNHYYRMLKEPSPKIQFSYRSQLSHRESFTKLPQSVKSCFLRRSASDKQMESFDLQNIIVRSTLTGNTCKLCETRYKIDEMGSVNEECGHSFCRKCIHDYVIYKISVLEEITCPQEDCPLSIDTNNRCFLEIPQDYKKKYKKYQLWRQTISNPNLRLCPAQNCEGVIETNISYACKTCRTLFCKECMLRAHEGACDANFQNNFKEWKRCPNCSMFIEKTEGCNHMTCLCSHEFCYVCLADWQQQHYNCGENGHFGQGGPFFQYLLPQQVVHLQQWKKKCIGVLMIIALPMVAVLGLALIPVCMAICAALAGLVGSCVIAANLYCDQMCCICLLIFVLTLPITIFVAAVGVGLFVLVKGLQIYFHLMHSYLLTIRFLICSAAEEPIEPFDLIDLQEPI